MSKNLNHLIINIDDIVRPTQVEADLNILEENFKNKKTCKTSNGHAYTKS